MIKDKKRIGFFILVALALFFLSWLIYFLWHRYHYAVTDAVFVQADNLIYVSFPKVNGKLIKLYKNEGDLVKKGEILAEIESTDYALKVAQLEKALKEVENQQSALGFNIAKLEKEIPLKVDQLTKQKDRLKEEERAKFYDIEKLKARLNQVRRDKVRYEKLYKDGLISAHELEEIQTQEKELENQISSVSAQLLAIKKQQEEIDKNIALTLNEKNTVLAYKSFLLSLEAKKKNLEKQKEEAEVYHTYTKLYSPVDGVIAKKFHSEGDVLNPGEPVYAIVDPNSFYVLVLLEETKLKGVKKGCPAKIKLDAYPDKDFEGIVDEVLPASAATFALVPRDISAGEFTKLAQRIYVKIKITKGDRSLLRVGLGGEVEIKRSL
ncbi:secretion protein HlyD family protein [Thermodesulfobacterium geofontis OPF15]|jgi:membrane fusion protein (multidrug efflux system)|uniref:Secretion protein HlyD family protein n=1 Tax=Thermodesulfobacterium geofontis (strain OPF15) TaxID=795359 RepID=F8C393_THEGP|nr:HlyD family secretion protein [Thermodesulfobacterium geofontis]AEH22403.1 secretion protein HlyD family protein [Thermodesulfobacterium geofontis OPF15]